MDPIKAKTLARFKAVKPSLYRLNAPQKRKWE